MERTRPFREPHLCDVLQMVGRPGSGEGSRDFFEEESSNTRRPIHHHLSDSSRIEPAQARPQCVAAASAAGQPGKKGKPGQTQTQQRFDARAGSLPIGLTTTLHTDRLDLHTVAEDFCLAVPFICYNAKVEKLRSFVCAHIYVACMYKTRRC